MNIHKCIFGDLFPFNHDGVVRLAIGAISIWAIMNETNFVDDLDWRYDGVFFCLFHHWTLKASKKCFSFVILANFQNLDLSKIFVEFVKTESLLENPNLMLTVRKKYGHWQNICNKIVSS